MKISLGSVHVSDLRLVGIGLLMLLASGCAPRPATESVPNTSASPATSAAPAASAAPDSSAANRGVAADTGNADAVAPGNSAVSAASASRSPSTAPAASPAPPAADPAPASTAANSAELDAAVPNLAKRRQGFDWPQFLGPTGDSKSREKGILTNWPEAGPRLVWQRKIGEGYGIGSVSRGRFLQFDRYGDLARLICLNAETGEELWQFEYLTDYTDLYSYNGGPRASPVIDDERVYIYGVEGQLHCLRVTDGKVLWKHDLSQRFGVIQNFFGVGSTPVIEGDLLLVMVGGSPADDKLIPPGQLDRVSGDGSAVVAFDKRTGEVRYQISDELASYASMKVAGIGDRRYGFAFCRGGLLAFEPSSGKIDFHFPWRSRILESVNASTPVVMGDEVFISETYGIGSALLRVAPGQSTVLWQDSANRREKSFKAHWNTPIFVDGYLYGCSGRNPPDAELRCIEWKTGKVQWSIPNQVRTSLLYVDGHFLCLGEFGTLELIKVNPQKYEPIAEVTLRDTSGGPLPDGLAPRQLLRAPCWAAPILSHGLLYLRGDDRLVCLELIPENSQR